MSGMEMKGLLNVVGDHDGWCRTASYYPRVAAASINKAVSVSVSMSRLVCQMMAVLGKSACFIKPMVQIPEFFLCIGFQIPSLLTSLPDRERRQLQCMGPVKSMFICKIRSTSPECFQRRRHFSNAKLKVRRSFV